MRGVNDEVKRKAIFDYYRVNADILVLQETHSVPGCEKIWTSQWGGGTGIYSHGTSAARGIAVFVTKSIDPNIENIYVDNDGRFIVFDIVECEQKISVAALYAPNEDNPNFFEKIQGLLRGRSEHKILIGDFNLVLDVEIDRLNTYCNNMRSLEKVESIIEEFILKDIWRIHHPEAREYSWFKRGNIMKASRIDYALISSGIDQSVKMSSYLSGIKTDHRALYLVIDLKSFERGRGYWKLNNILLGESEYVKMMNIELEKFIEQNRDEKAVEIWEKLKLKIKKLSIEYSKNRTSESKIAIAQLSELVSDYEARLPLNQGEDNLYEKTKKDLEEKLFERAKGMLFRSKVRWYEEGERNTKYFFALEKARYNAKTCYKIISESGQEIIIPEQILSEQKEFYSKLYQKDENVHFDLKNSYGICVPEEIKLEQEKMLTLDDLQDAIKSMKNNKTPGQDGLPIDFYKVFRMKLRDLFCRVVEEVYDSEMLHSTARQGILNLIPKSNKDSRFIKNLRPITLLNTDYKIIEKAIALKMLPALDHIIHRDQRGFMKDRRISVNIRKILDIMYETEKEDFRSGDIITRFCEMFRQM